MPTQTLTFVIQQQIAGTRTYRVISPTRNNFVAANIFNREDMWGAITADELAKLKSKEENSKELQQKLSDIQQKAAVEEEDKKKLTNQNPSQDGISADATAAAEELRKQEKSLPEAPTPPEMSRVTVVAPPVEESMTIKTPYTPDIIKEANKQLGGPTIGPPTKPSNLPANAPAQVLYGKQSTPKSIVPTDNRVETALSYYGTQLKNEGVDISKLHPSAINAAAIASKTYQDVVGKPGILTSAYGGKHGEGSKHYTGEAVDFRTQHLGLSYNQKLALVEETRKRLNLGSYNYDVIFEGEGTSQEHIHIEYEGVKKGERDPFIVPTSKPGDENPAWWDIRQFFR